MSTLTRTRTVRLTAIGFVQIVAVLACSLLAGEPAASPNPAPSPTASPPSVAQPSPTPAPTEIASASNAPPQHHIAVRQINGVAEFFNRDTGEKFVPRGANYVYVPVDGHKVTETLKVGVYDPERTRRDFALLAENGYNTVRVFLDHCSAGPGCIGDSDNSGLNPAYLENIADMLAAAAETGLFILFTSNDLPDQGGYSQLANAGSGPIFAGYRNSFYLTPGAVLATRRYWRDLITGLIELQASTDHVLGWQLVNEQWMFRDQPPLSLTSGFAETTTGRYDLSDPEQKRRMVSEGLIHYIAEVKAEILMHDPTALVTMGFFAPELVAPDWYVETASLLAGADLDFFDFHAYPGGLSLGRLAAAFGMDGFDSKPIILGEYGAFRHIFPNPTAAARAVTQWQADSCAYGFDGWLYWAFYSADPSVGDSTYGLVDDSNAILHLLAPAAHPDPCQEVFVSSGNVALGKPVKASASLPAEPPGNAVDENGLTQWGAGAHPPQWIEIDLGQAYRVTEIRLLVAQFPEGNTVHRLQGRRADGDFVALYTFRQFTSGGQWLVFTPDPPVGNVQIIRIETLTSPSWAAWSEIEIYGEPVP